MDSKSKKIAVTGASGFVGKQLVARLRARGEPVACLLRPASKADGLDDSGIEIRRGQSQPWSRSRAAGKEG